MILSHPDVSIPPLSPFLSEVSKERTDGPRHCTVLETTVAHAVLRNMDTERTLHGTRNQSCKGTTSCVAAGGAAALEWRPWRMGGSGQSRLSGRLGTGEPGV